MTFQPQALTLDLSTPDFSTMILSTPDFWTMKFWTMGLKSSWLKSPGLKCHLSRRLKDISTLDFSTPDFSTMNFSTPDFSTMNFSTPWFKNSWLKSWVEAWGWKVWGWDVLQPFQTCGTIVEIHQLQSFIQQLIDIFIVPTEPNTFTIAAPFVGTDWFKHISHCELWIKWTIVPLKPFGTWSSTNWSIWVYLNWKKNIC